ncbi:MAG: hypothetical protein HXS51_07985 [Theionarchaea archaeon]|nr:hypothetical protein [Theionarchaea archaeon]
MDIIRLDLRTIKSVLYSIIWIVITASLWFLWLLGLEGLVPVGDFTFVMLYGTLMGAGSGFSPRKAFSICFLGFFIIAVLLGLAFPVGFGALLLLSVFCAIFAMIGAIIRRLITQKKIEELYLNPWEWVVLVAGISLLVDYTVIGRAYSQLLTYGRVFTFLRWVTSGSVGLFLLGMYAGAFRYEDHKLSMKSLIGFSTGGHTIYVLYKSYLYVIGHMSSRAFLLVFLIVLTFISAFFIGTKTGSWRRVSRRKMGYSSRMGVL